MSFFMVPLLFKISAGAQFSNGIEWKQKKMKINNQMAKPTTYSASVSTNIPLYESPLASFDQYLENKSRVLKAIFPDEQRSQKLNEVFFRAIFLLKIGQQDEWRIQMLPVRFLLLNVSPVVVMRLRHKSGGTDYPPSVSHDITTVVELDITRWELHGLDEILKSSEFTLGVKGSLYPDRQGPQTRLKGQLQISINFVLPPILALVPDNVLQNVADSLLKRLVMNMKHTGNSSLLADYSEFKREKLEAIA